ncbi:MAG: selenide, water dikinase SelD, partial [Acidobacteria bacterium]|nr:selenide, water dikinase SelD [Acidobacteriota bacterium]
ISTGIKFGKASAEVMRASLDTMLLAGRDAARAMVEAEAHAATDITGFALLGHAWEMARGSRVTLEIEAESVPLIAGALELAAQGLLTSGDKSNRQYVGDDVEFGEGISKELSSLLFDPQTAGGLLISVAEERAVELLSRLREKYRDAAVIGRVVEHGTHLLVVE